VVRSRPSFSSRTIGAVLAPAIVGLIVAPLWVIDIGHGPTTFHEVLPLGATLAFFAILGWWAGRAAATGDWWQAIVTGLGLGIGWCPAALSVAAIASLVDVVVRGGPIGGIGPEFLWALYALSVVIALAALIGIPNGLAWAIATHWTATRSDRLDREPVRRNPSLTAVGALFVLGISTGTALAIAAPIGR
jgi:hypothetical protein